jgi:hypothetical protein
MATSGLTTLEGHALTGTGTDSTKGVTLWHVTCECGWTAVDYVEQRQAVYAHQWHIDTVEARMDAEREIADAAELLAWRTLAAKCTLNEFPLLPNPSWPQDVAFVAYSIDNLRRGLAEAQQAVALDPCLIPEHAALREAAQKVADAWIGLGPTSAAEVIKGRLSQECPTLVNAIMNLLDEL